MRIFLWFHYIFIFMPWEILKSSFQVAFAILFPSKGVKPGFLAIPIDLKSDWAIAVMANSITLTPGTLTVDISKDKKTLYIHCLAIENPEGFKRAIKEVFENKIKRLEGKRR